MEASKTTSEPAEYERRPLTTWSDLTHTHTQLDLHNKSASHRLCPVSLDEPYPGCPYGALDSGFNSVDSGDKRWLGNEVTRAHVHMHVK